VPLKSAGKTITKINHTKKGVTLYLDQTKLVITQDAFLSQYLYVGKTLTNKEINSLKHISMEAKLIDYSLSLLKKNHYTEWKMREKLYNKDADKEQVDFVIKKLKTHDLINDFMYAMDYTEYCHENNVGKNKIIQGLKTRGVFEKDINKIKFSSTLEKQKAKNQLAKLEKKYDKLAYRKKRDHIYSSLISLGFDHDIAIDIVDKMKPMKENEEKNKIDRDFLLINRRLSNKYEGKELKEKVFKALHNKGYSYSKIKTVMEENYDY
jgi:regulatory protein